MPPRLEDEAEAGWLWVVILRGGLAVSMAVFAITFHATKDHPAPTGLVPLSLLLAGVPATLAVLQAMSRFRRLRRFGLTCFVADAASVLGLLALHVFDPGRVAFGLIVVVQAEGGLLLGLPGAVVGWAVTTALAVVVELVSVAQTNVHIQPRAMILQIAAGALLAVGGGALSEELSGERARELVRRSRELQASREAEARFRSLVERTPAVTYVETGARLRSTAYMSPQVAHMLGYPPADWTDDPELWASRLHPDDRTRVLADADRVSANGEPFVEEYRMFARDGRVVWVRDEAVAIPGPEGNRAWQGVVVDITDRRRAEEEVAFLAYHDKLTGLPNRTMFEETLGPALARARRRGQAMAVLYLDLDDFKRVNDTLGHNAGDDVLRQVAVRLREAVRESDVVARHGGDEFLVLLDDLADEDGGPGGAADAAELARAVADRIRGALQAPIPLGGTELTVTGSIGIAVSRGSREDEAWLVRRADAAMYRTKRESPGGVALASDADEPAAGGLEAERLRLAVEGDGLVVHYQPIVDLTTARVVGVEALVRWHDEDGRLIPAAEFLPLAEHLGLTVAIDERVMRDAFAACSAWEAGGLDVGSVSVNLSAAGLGGPDLRSGVLERLEATGVDPSRLMLEVAESTLLAAGAAGHALAALHDAGVRLAVDDFGSGVSSLARLRDLPVDVIKVDRPFLRGVPDDPNAVRLLEAVIQLVRSLGAEPSAEGVETEGQRAALVAMGCRLGQGFRFSPAVPAEQVEPLVRSGALAG